MEVAGCDVSTSKNVRNINKIVSGLRSSRDLRAEILSLAHALHTHAGTGRLELRAPRISETAIKKEWAQSLSVLMPAVAARMRLEYIPDSRRDSLAPARYQSDELVPIQRPNYRFEVLRWLITAAADQAGQSVKSLETLTSVSRTPIEAALNALETARLIGRTKRGQYIVRPEDISQDVLAKVQALPQTIRFRYGLGSSPRPPGQLVPKLIRLMDATRPKSWLSDACLSGVAGAYATQRIDLLGVPRVDIVVRVRRNDRVVDAAAMRDLDDGLEVDPSPLGHAPVVVTLVHSEHVTQASPVAKLASPGDIFLSMVDLGLKGPAMEYINGLKK